MDIASSKVKRVLFFDSGVGGLSVYRDVKAENSCMEGVYLFDHECFPYGTKSEDFLEQRVTSLLKSAVTQFKVCAVVIACNTASTLVLPAVRRNLEIPIIGVVPAIKPAARMSKKKIIGLMATPGTVQREYTRKLISDYASDCRIIGIPSPVLATIAENRLATGVVDEKGIESLLKPIMKLKPEDKPDVIVLGCTHYPFVADVLKKLLPDVEFIDSGRAIGRRVRQVLFELGDSAYSKSQGSHAYYTGMLSNFAEKEIMVRKFGFESLNFFKI